MMVVAAQAGLISLNCFLPGSDGPLDAQTFPEALIMRNMSGEVTCRSLLKDLRARFHLCWSWAHRKICFRAWWKFSSEGVAVGLRTTDGRRLRTGDGVSAAKLSVSRSPWVQPSGLHGSALGLPPLAWITALAPDCSGSAFGPLVMSILCRNASDFSSQFGQGTLLVKTFLRFFFVFMI